MYDIFVIVILVIMVLFIVYSFYIDYSDWSNTGNTFAEGFNDYGKGMDNVGNRGRQLLPLIDYGWKGFEKKDGKFKQISETKEYIYAINLQNEIFKCKKPCDGNWEKVPGSLKQLSPSTNDMWGVNKSNEIFKKGKNWIWDFKSLWWKPTGTWGGWKQVGGQLKQVSASGKGYVWGVNEKNQVFNCKKPCPPWAGDGPLHFNESQPLYKRPPNTYKPQNKGNSPDSNTKLKKGEGNCRIKHTQTYKVLEKRIVPEKCSIGYNESYVEKINHPEKKIQHPAVIKYHPAQKTYFPASSSTNCYPVKRRGKKYTVNKSRKNYIINIWGIRIQNPFDPVSRWTETRRRPDYWEDECRTTYHAAWERTDKAAWQEVQKEAWEETINPWTEEIPKSRWVDGDAVTNTTTKAYCDEEYPGWKEAGTDNNGVIPIDLNKTGRCANFQGNRTSINVNSLEECAKACVNDDCGVFSYNKSGGCMFVKKKDTRSKYTIQGVTSGCQPEYWGGWKFYKTKRGKVAKKNAIVHKPVDKLGWKPPLPDGFGKDPPPPPKCTKNVRLWKTEIGQKPRRWWEPPNLLDFSPNYRNPWWRYYWPRLKRGEIPWIDETTGYWGYYGFNDRVKAAEVPEGCQVTLYRHSNFRGKLGTLGPGVYNVQKFKTLIQPNVASSLKITSAPPPEKKDEMMSESDYKNKYGNKNWMPDAMCEDGLTCSKPNGGKQRLPGIYWGLDATNQWSENANTGFCYDKNDVQYERNGESEKGYFHGLPYNNDPNDTQQWNQEHRHYFWVSMNPEKLPPKKKKYSVKILQDDWSTVKKRVQRYCSNAKLIKTESGVHTFKCLGHKNNILPDWKYHIGDMTQVSGGDKFVWGINKDNTIWRKPINGNGSWKQIKGNAKFINATDKDFVYIVDKNDQILKCAKPCDDSKWQKIQQRIRGSKNAVKANKVTGSNAVVWAIDNVNNIFKTISVLNLPFGQTKLGKCEGDCASNDDCQKNLKCYKRKHSGDVPDGCKAGGPGDIPTHSYCYDYVWNFVPEAPPDETDVCTTVEECKKVAKEKGYRLGTEEQNTDDNPTAESFTNKGRPFASDDDSTKGLYSYKSGQYKGVAFFGKGGTDEEISAPFPKDSNKYRPENLKEGEEYEKYYCSSRDGERLGKWDAKSQKDCVAQCKGKYPSRKGHKCFNAPHPPPSTIIEGGSGTCPTGCKKPTCVKGNCTDKIIDGIVYKSCPATCSNVEGAGGGCKYDIDCPEEKCGAVYFNAGDEQECRTEYKQLSRMIFDREAGKFRPRRIDEPVYNGPLKDYHTRKAIKDDELQGAIFNKELLKQVLANKNLIPNDINIKIEKQGNFIRIGKNLMSDVSYIRNVSLPDITNEDYERLGRIIIKIKEKGLSTGGQPNNVLSNHLTNYVNDILTPSLRAKNTTGMFGDNSNSLMSNTDYNSIWNIFQ